VIRLALGLLAWAYAVQPAALRRLWGRALGALIRHAGLRGKVIADNLKIAYPDDEVRREELYREAYAHLGQLTLEILLLLGPAALMRRYVAKWGELRGAEHWRAAQAGGKGSIFLSSHVGNWELMAATGAMHGPMNLLLVTKQLKPGWFHRAIEAGRASCGVRGTYEPRTFRDVLSHLKKGGTVGFVLDQYTGPPVGIRVPFLGATVGTHSALATLVKRTGARVVPVLNYRTPEGRQVVEIQPALSWIEDEDPNLELARNTANYAAVLETHVRAHAEEWLWTHRRFKGDLSPLREGEWREGRARR
jgi:KDO2-lipid IV(A) lauroyltransferase